MSTRSRTDAFAARSSRAVALFGLASASLALVAAASCTDHFDDIYCGTTCYPTDAGADGSAGSGGDGGASGAAGSSGDGGAHAGGGAGEGGGGGTGGTGDSAGAAGGSAGSGGSSPSCTAGETKCVGDSLATCVSDGTFAAPVFCGAGFSCAAGACTGIAQITAGGDHSCVRLTDGSVRCWGSNVHGEIGAGIAASPTPVTKPVVVTGLSDAVWVSAGQSHSCAVSKLGTVSCWGANDSGQLGAGDAQLGKSSIVPIAVGGISDAQSVFAGAIHTCVLRSGGAVSCWGSDAHGQLGDAQSSPSAISQPISSTSIPIASGLAVGDVRTCAIGTDKSVRCWGANGFGAGALGSDVVAGEPVGGMTGVIIEKKKNPSSPQG